MNKVNRDRNIQMAEIRRVVSKNSNCKLCKIKQTTILFSLLYHHFYLQPYKNMYVPHNCSLKCQSFVHPHCKNLIPSRVMMLVVILYRSWFQMIFPNTHLIVFAKINSFFFWALLERFWALLTLPGTFSVSTGSILFDSYLF